MVENKDLPTGTKGKKNRWKGFGAGILCVFILGLGCGYYMWEYRGNKAPDYKKTLTEVSNYIATIEHKNRGLRKKVNGLEERINTLEAGAAASADAASQEAGLRSSIKVLEENLNASKKRNQALAMENKDLKARLSASAEQKKDAQGADMTYTYSTTM
ncbi:MAG: hypothetical protein U9P80_01305 [Thermodesulfobacteriota bacterium]|nr:hypothetical protein [Thermodesulfobacteriota bacterium]